VDSCLPFTAFLFNCVTPESNELAAKLLESRSNLQKASSALATSAAEIELDRLEQAIQYQRELAKADNPAEKLALEQAINALGQSSGVSEVQLLMQRKQLEEEIFEQKRQSLLLEQDRQRKSLELDLTRNQLAAQKAVLEARQAEIQAKQNQLTAENNLLIAQRNPKDTQAIANAQTALELAKQSTSLASEGTGMAKSELAAQKELGKNARKTLALDQTRELGKLDAGNQKQQAELTLAIAKAQIPKPTQDQKSQEQLNKSLDKTTKAADDLASSFGQLQKESQGKDKTKVVTVSSRRQGGPMSAGEPYLVGDGPGGEFIPGLSEVVVPGVSSYVLAAQQASQFFSPISTTRLPVPAVPNSRSDQQDLLKEIQGLRSDIRQRRPISNNQFTFNREGDEMDKLAQVLDAIRSTMF